MPSQVHPSYPYGNPTNIKHPAARPRRPADFSSRALFSDLSYAGGGVNGALRWRDLALEQLLPVDRAREEAARAALARKLASGSGQSNNPSQGDAQAQAAGAPQQATDSEEEPDEDEESTDYMDDRCVRDLYVSPPSHLSTSASSMGDEDEENENSNMEG